MKTFKYALMLVMVFAMSVSLVSCGDDKNKGENSPLAGKWYSSEFYTGLTLTFKADNTFIEDWYDVTKGKYYYDSKTKIITFVENSGHSYSRYVHVLNDTDLVLGYLDGTDEFSYKRVE